MTCVIVYMNTPISMCAKLHTMIYIIYAIIMYIAGLHTNLKKHML